MTVVDRRVKDIQNLQSPLAISDSAALDFQSERQVPRNSSEFIEEPHVMHPGPAPENMRTASIKRSISPEENESMEAVAGQLLQDAAMRATIERER